ncbi:MAG TPA: pentapeptide repeat-containing protein, partial [Allocoleopsis sp.]
TQIEELVIERLRREEKRNPHTFSFAVLLERLYPFYRAYCQSQWLDAGIAHQTHAQLKALHHPLTVLQLDAAVGLNVFLLLCSAAREAKISFWPCGNPNRPQEFDPDRLLSFIARTATLCPTTFWQRVRQSLANLQLAQVCLHHVMLAEANLSQTNLSGANLIGMNLATANLHNANLSLANLSGANLANANLSGANLEGTDLSGANLIGATLKFAHFSNACLFQAQLDELTKSFAVKSGAIFSLEEFWAYKRALTPKIALSYLTEDGILDQEPTIFIESAEGEPLLPEQAYSNEQEEDGYEGDTVWVDDSERENLVLYTEDDELDEGKDTIRLPESFGNNINAQTDAL